jgi:hypothetical protein
VERGQLAAQMFLTTDDTIETGLGCTDHPQYGMTALEQITKEVPVKLTREDGEVVIDVSASSEFVTEIASSITIGYKCAHPDCTFFVGPTDLHTLKERHVAVDKRI